MDETPRKVDASHIEVISKSGEVIQEAADKEAVSGFAGFSGVKVIKAGPAMLLLLPLIIPILIVGFFVMMILTLFFGKGIFRIATSGLRRR